MAMLWKDKTSYVSFHVKRVHQDYEEFVGWPVMSEIKWNGYQADLFNNLMACLMGNKCYRNLVNFARMVVVVFQMGRMRTVHWRDERDSCWCCGLSLCRCSWRQENVTQFWPKQNSSLAAVIFCLRWCIFNTIDALTESMRSFTLHSFYPQDLNHLNDWLASACSERHRYSGIYLYNEGKFWSVFIAVWI